MRRAPLRLRRASLALTPPLRVLRSSGAAKGLVVGAALAAVLQRARQARMEPAVALGPRPPRALTRRLTRSVSDVLKQSSSNASGMARALAQVRKALRLFWRFLRLSVLGSPAVVLGPLLLGPKTAQDVWWGYTVWAIEAAGPALIKLAQWVTTRPDLVSSSIVDRLRALQDDTSPHAFAHTEAVMTASFGPAWRELVDLDEKSPVLGSGSIAQVYRGYHTEDRQQVAVKVLHPNVHEVIEEDVSLLLNAAQMVEWAYPELKYAAVAETVEEFGCLLEQQLDLRTEASNLRRLGRNFKKFKGVTFPEPKDGLVAEQALVESFVRGRPLLDMVGSSVATQLSKWGCRTVLEMLFYHNFVHGDLHPGNLLYTDDGRIGILDAGICMTMDEDHHANMMIILTSFMKADGRTAALTMVDSSRANQPKDVDEFVAGIVGMVDASHQQTFFDHAGEYVTDICALACKHHVKLDPVFITSALAMKLIEGTAMALDPSVSLVEMGLPMAISDLTFTYMRMPWAKTEKAGSRTFFGFTF